MSKKPKIGDRLHVRVAKLLPFGLLVDFAESGQGVVREREISWHAETIRNWRKQFNIGHEYDAILLSDSGAYLELSLRFAESDPWCNVPNHYQMGQLVDGVVAGLAPYGAFIELEPGVTGLLHASRLPGWATQPIDELLWVGDRVKAIVQTVNVAKRTIDLSMERIAEQRWNSHSALQSDGEVDRLGRGAANDDEAQAEAIHTPLEILAQQAARAFLLIEDDVQQNQALSRWLRNAGQHVETALSGEDALELLKAHRVEIVLSDVVLPGIDGIQIVRYVLDHYPQVNCILMTDWATADHRRDELVNLERNGVGLLLKPLLPEDLLRILDGAIVARNDQAAHRIANGARSAVVQSSQTKTRPISVKQSLHNVLRSVRRQTRATKVILFALDPDQRQVHIFDHSGQTPLNSDAIVDLLHSPVRDVAEDRIAVQIEDVYQAEAYVRHLKPLLEFRSCIGVPVLGNLTQKYALFLFHTQAGFTEASIKINAETIAMTIGALLEQQALLEHEADMQRMALMGQLSRALVHETNHQLNPIVFALDELRSQCVRVDDAIHGSHDQLDHEMREAQAVLRQLSEGVQKLVKTTRLFGRITVQDQEEMVRVDRVINQCIELVRDLADRSKVTIYFHPPKQIIVTRARYTQIQQIILNLLINAVQQITLWRPKQGGEVRISLNLQNNAKDERYICIHIEDDGPGIHRRLWERIFELGFTTRKEGSGLGLFMAKYLTENIGGRLYIDDSAMLWGARLSVEFPVHIG